MIETLCGIVWRPVSQDGGFYVACRILVFGSLYFARILGAFRKRTRVKISKAALNGSAKPGFPQAIETHDVNKRAIQDTIMGGYLVHHNGFDIMFQYRTLLVGPFGPVVGFNLVNYD